MIVANRRKPLRRCIGCGQRKEKAAMIRIVRTPEGILEVDDRGKKPGRGCYVCPDPDCLAGALSKGKLSRALRMEDPDEDTRDDLREKIDDLIDNNAGEVRR